MKKNNIYLATKLYSFFDRKASVVMYNSVFNSKKFNDDNIYLPFKDSNMKVSTVVNIAKNIFETDIKSLTNTDFYKNKLSSNIEYKLLPIIDWIGNIFKYEYSDNDKKFDIFIDFSGLKYEWNKIIVDKITKILDKNRITYWISNRYLS